MNELVPPYNPKKGDQWAFEVVNQLKPGARYTAFYDPDHPHKLMLSKPSLTTWYVIAMMPVALLIVVGAALRAWLKRPPAEPVATAGAGELVLIIP